MPLEASSYLGSNIDVHHSCIGAPFLPSPVTPSDYLCLLDALFEEQCIPNSSSAS